MASKSLPSKAAQKKAALPTTNDPDFIALRLKGLARLIDCASTTTIDMNPIDHDAAYFISTELRDLASRLLNESRS